MRRGSVSAGDLETALGTSIRSVAQKKAKTAKSADIEDSVASPMHVMEGDVFENALEDHGQGGQLDYEVDYDDDDEEGSKFEVEEEGYLEDEDMVSGDEEKEEVVKVVVKEKEQLQKKVRRNIYARRQCTTIIHSSASLRDRFSYSSLDYALAFAFTFIFTLTSRFAL